jgi:hypothetical protein
MFSLPIRDGTNHFDLMHDLLGVVVPTRNCAARLMRHLAAMGEWLDIADQVVVVDSFSTDGTPELLRRALGRPSVRFISHPPGLYESWNAAVQLLSTEYTYISTVGDTITRAGLSRLVDSARGMGVDVVISKPLFQTVDGAAVHRDWPIDDIIGTLEIDGARRLRRLEAIIFACAHASVALTGNCASDLFRTECLQRLPFPTGFGTSGDGVWGLRNAAEVSWGVVSGNFSSFLCHPTDSTPAENPPATSAPSAIELLRRAVAHWKSEGHVSEAELENAGWARLEAAAMGYLEAKSDYDRLRKGKVPWFVLPAAWRARMRRQRLNAQLHACKMESLAAVSAGESALIKQAMGGEDRRP